MDNRLSFITGWIFTTVSTISAMGMLQAAAIGLIGGFFGLVGKELYYFVKSEIKKRNEAE